jgi:uncharacterized protein involved in response to NO
MSSLCRNCIWLLSTLTALTSIVWLLLSLVLFASFEVPLMLIGLAGCWSFIALFWVRVAIHRGQIHKVPLFFWITIVAASAVITSIAFQYANSEYKIWNLQDAISMFSMFVVLLGGAPVALTLISVRQLLIAKWRLKA